MMGDCAHTRRFRAPEDPLHQYLSSRGPREPWERLAANAAGLLVIRNDRIVFERYAAGRQPNHRHYAASAAKGLAARYTPTKWISTDGIEFQLVFSGDDDLSIRGGRLRAGP